MAWHNPPVGARSFVLIMDDPDATRRTITHWLVYDIPDYVRELPCNDDEIGIPGRNDFQCTGYSGPCPLANHVEDRYFFHVFALDVESLKLAMGADRDQVEQAMLGHVAAETTLMGRYAPTQ